MDSFRISIEQAAPNATALLASERRHREALFVENIKDDLEGGLRDGQSGQTFFAAKALVRAGVDAHLQSRYVSSVGSLSRWDLLAETEGEESPVFVTGWRLENANPGTPDELAEFVTQALNFVDNVLSIKPPRYMSGYFDEASYHAYIAHSREVDALASFLQVESPFSPRGLARFIPGISDPGMTMSKLEESRGDTADLAGDEDGEA